MPELLMPLIAIAAYAAATALLLSRLRRGDPRDAATGWILLPALLLHAAAHGHAWWQLRAPELHFFAALSLVGLGMAGLTVLTARRQKLLALGVVVYPIAAATLVAYLATGTGTAKPMDWPLQLHAWLALLAYATLAISALLAVLLWGQERALRRRRLQPWLRLLPPLTQLEALLFRSLAVGFVLLGLVLLTGVLFVADLFAQHLVHKTVLSLLSWLVLAVLLFGRWRWGWRGPRATSLTLVAMGLLLLAFFGSKFVLELVLQRT